MLYLWTVIYRKDNKNFHFCLLDLSVLHVNQILHSALHSYFEFVMFYQNSQVCCFLNLFSL